MKFKITFSDGVVEEREMSDCSTAEEALNTVAGSVSGVTVTEVAEAPPEPPPA
jgi:hypothetical protein